MPYSHVISLDSIFNPSCRCTSCLASIEKSASGGFFVRRSLRLKNIFIKINRYLIEGVYD